MDRARQDGELRTLITQHSAVLAPFGWMLGAEVVALLAFHAVRGLHALVFTVACSLLAGARTYFRLRNRTHGHSYARTTWGLGSCWTVIASVAGPWPVMTLILVLGTFALSAEHWWRNRADRVEIVPSSTEILEADPDDIVDAEVVEHPDMEVGSEDPYASAVVTGPEAAEDGAYAAPGVSSLKTAPPPKVRGTRDKAREAIDAVLEENDVDARVTDLTRGPAVTRYQVQKGRGVNVREIMRLEQDIAYQVGNDLVRMLAPVPGMSAIGVEIPNEIRDIVTLGDILRSPAALADRHPLTVGLGLDVEGSAVVAALAKMPHLLIAGATGAGKSTCIDALIVSILTRATPEQVRLLLIDLKRVELAAYRGVPHLAEPIITAPGKAAAGLERLCAEMDRRYDAMAAAGVRSIDDFNLNARAGRIVLPGEHEPAKPYPYLLGIVDQLADLMMAKMPDPGMPDDDRTIRDRVEAAIVRITQLARAAGIHLVLATQRPEVAVVTGLIKANVPSRLAFMTASGTDSKVILDGVGAEKLIGQGDALFKPVGTTRPIRLQGAFVTRQEIADTVAQCQRAAHPGSPALTVVQDTSVPPAAPATEDPALLADCAEIIIATQHGSVSMLQRKFRILYAQAGRVMDALEAKGIVGPANGSLAREVLVGPDDKDAAVAALREGK